jgi:hypothetical protein
MSILSKENVEINVLKIKKGIIFSKGIIIVCLANFILCISNILSSNFDLGRLIINSTMGIVSLSLCYVCYKKIKMSNETLKLLLEVKYD